MNPAKYRDAWNWKRKVLANSNDNNFLLGCPIQSLIYEDARNWKRKLVANSNDNNF